MSAIWGAVKVTVNVLGWIFLLTFGLCMAGVIAVALTDWYRKLRHRRRDQDARAATLRARQERNSDRETLAAMESQFSSEGGAP